jgi:hypothetical protein
MQFPGTIPTAPTKTWYAKMNADVVRGGWVPDEDQRLLSAIDRFGTKFVDFYLSLKSLTPKFRWAIVASVVQTRSSDRTLRRFAG